MGKGVNRVRYWYFSSFDFYYFLGGLLGVATGIIVSLFFLNQSGLFSFLWAITFPVGILTTLLIGRTFFSIDRPRSIQAGITGGATGLLSSYGLALLLYSPSPIGYFLGGLMVTVCIAWTIFHFSRAARVLIFPNRIIIGDLALHFKDFVNVDWGVGTLEEVTGRFSAEQKAKKLEVLTPLAFESGGKDFTLYHFYVLMETTDTIYVAQPIFWRNSFAQNVKNAWLEGWRWDGSTTPPIDWEPQKLYRITDGK